MAASSAPQGGKRKLGASDDGEQPEASSSRIPAGGGGPSAGGGRVTRRSAAAAAAASASPAQAATAASGGQKRHAPIGSAGDTSWNVSAEAGPSGREARSTTAHKPAKRPRKSSSISRRTASNISAQPNAQASTSPRKATALSPSKEREAYLSYLLPRAHLPYPIGLTPFRYPCLHPTIPAPPAGDPLNPKWKPYDPNHVSHLDPLPDSVRALSALGREPRMYRVGEGGSRGGAPLGAEAVSQAGPTSSSGQQQPGHPFPPFSSRPGPSNGHQTQSNAHAHMLDPELASLPHPPPPPQPVPFPLSSAQHLEAVLPGEGDAPFDINTFFESASYETISALLATGDNVGGDASGSGAS